MPKIINYSLIFIILILFKNFNRFGKNRLRYLYKKYSVVYNSKELSATDIARKMLDDNGLSNVNIKHIEGELTDNYDSSSQTVNLSDLVYASQSISALSVAAHLVGHAIQHNTGYSPYKSQLEFVQLAKYGAYGAIVLLIIGTVLSFKLLVVIGIIMLIFISILNLVTKPCEFNANSRAMATLIKLRILDYKELEISKKVLSVIALWSM